MILFSRDNRAACPECSGLIVGRGNYYFCVDCEASFVGVGEGRTDGEIAIEPFFENMICNS